MHTASNISWVMKLIDCKVSDIKEEIEVEWKSSTENCFGNHAVLQIGIIIIYH